MVHILHPRNDVVREFDGKYLVGRGQDCDLKVSDISVSRNHCQIQFKKEKNGSKFWLQDSLSKFGTLALARGLVEILPGTTTGMQIGRTLMIFQTRSIFQKDLQVGNQIIRATEDSQI
jgi:predicted component of type VI protein secretion system